jgi:hypothetical protein
MKHLLTFKLFEGLNNGINSVFPDNFNFYKDPEKLYHLTNNPSVKTDGLLINKSKSHHFIEGIYLTDSLYVASNYRYLDGEKKDWYIIEIPFKNLNIEKMYPDDYELFDLIDDTYTYVLDYFGIDETRGNQKMIWESLDYRHSLYLCEQLIYNDNITPDKFSKMLTEDEVNKELQINFN